jgi:hypothetical protein
MLSTTVKREMWALKHHVSRRNQNIQKSEMNQVQTIKKRPVHCTMNEIESSKRWEVEMFNFVQIQKLEMKEVMLISTLICMKHSMVDQQISWFTSFSTALEKVPQNTET